MKRRVLAVLVVLVFVVVAVRSFLGSPDGEGADALPLVSFSVLDGAAQREPSGGTPVGALDGDALGPGDAISTDAEGVALLTFFDGSTIQLEPLTRVAIRELSRSRDGAHTIVVEQTDGQTWASVATQAPNARFEILMPDSTAVIKGTALKTTVNKKAGTSSVYVDQGAVQMSSAKGMQNVAAGDIGVSKAGEVAPPIPLKWANDAEYLRWYNSCSDVGANWALIEACSRSKNYTWSLFIRPDQGTLATIVDYKGRRCDARGSELPSCSRDSGNDLKFRPYEHITQAREGVFAVTLRPAQGSGTVRAKIESFGHWCYGSFSGSCVFDASGGSSRPIGSVSVPAGATARVFFRVFWLPTSLGFDVDPHVEILAAPPATPTPAPSGASPAPTTPPRGSVQCVADTVGSAFSTGALLDRSQAFFDYARDNPGRAAALVVSEDDIGSGLSDAVKGLPISIRDVRPRIQGSKVRLTGQVLQFGVRLEVQISVRYGQLDLSYRFEDVPQWVQDQIPRSGLSTWLSGMNNGSASWQRILWRDGCFALVGAGSAQPGTSVQSAPQSAPTPTPGPTRTPDATPAPVVTPAPSADTTVAGPTPSPSASSPVGVRTGRPPAADIPGRVEPSWTTIGTWTRSSQFGRTPYFTVTGSEWRVRWTLAGPCCTANDWLVVNVYYNYGNFDRLLKQVCCAGKQPTGEELLDGPGYFAVALEQATSSSWLIVVEELK